MKTKQATHKADCLKATGAQTQFDLSCNRCNKDSYDAVTALRPAAESWEKSEAHGAQRHTPTPWTLGVAFPHKVYAAMSPDYFEEIVACDGNAPGEAEANAAFIVRAVNNIGRYEQLERNLLEIIETEGSVVMREMALRAEIKAFAEETKDIARAEGRL
jgi:hypothetical protein